MLEVGRGKSPMVMDEVNVSLIVPNSINVIVNTNQDYITYVNIDIFSAIELNISI